MIAADLESLIGNAGEGLDYLTGMTPEIRAKAELARAKTEEDRRTIAKAWARFAESPDGQKALEAMLDTTLRRTVYFVNLGQDINSMAVWGAFREGQNALAQEIVRQISIGRHDEDQPKPRDVT